MKFRNVLLMLCVLALGACGSVDDPQPDGSTPSRNDGGFNPDPERDSGRPNPDRDGGEDPQPTGDFECTRGTVFAGYPTFDSEVGARAREGDPLRGVEGRPLLWRKVIFVGDYIVTVTGQEVWASDLSAASPTLFRVAGREEGPALADGPCDDARFANLMDVVADSQGSLFVMDQTANTILKITDPFDDEACTVHYWAGTSFDIPSISPPSPPNVGYEDGPGLSAKFGLPGRMTIDESDNLYVWDENNAKIRKIANDAGHTVSTFVAVESVFDGRTQDVIVDSMLVTGGHLVLFQHDTANQTFLEKVNLATAARTDIFRGRADLFGFASSASNQNGGIVASGTDLILWYKGGMFRVSSGGEITHIAGDLSVRSTIEFGPGYDPEDIYDAFDIQLANRPQWSTAGAESWLAIDENDDLYFIGMVEDPYVQKLECGR